MGEASKPTARSLTAWRLRRRLTRRCSKSVRGRVGVSTQDGLTLGMTIMDRRHHHVWTNLPEINVAVSADYARFLHGLIEDFLK